jgi:toxin ParE1/3/4
LIRVFFHPQAEEELDTSIGFYEDREPGLGLDLEREVLHGMFQIQDAPNRWPQHRHGTRKYLLKRFPFHLVYLDMPDALWIVAVAHCARRPGYWKERLKDLPPDSQ